MDFFNKTLIKPFAQAMQALNLAQNVTRNLYNNDYSGNSISV